jgi:hypothetical protein
MAGFSHHTLSISRLTIITSLCVQVHASFVIVFVVHLWFVYCVLFFYSSRAGTYNINSVYPVSIYLAIKNK